MLYEYSFYQDAYNPVINVDKKDYVSPLLL
jgi:hypothetical protein